MPEIEIKIVAPGPSDDPTTLHVQELLDSLDAQKRWRIQTYQRAELAHEGGKAAIAKQIEEVHEEDADLSGRIGHLERQLRHGLARSDETDEQLEAWWAARKRISETSKALQDEKSRGIFTPYSGIMNRLKTVKGELVAVEPPVVPKGRSAEEMYVEMYAARAERITEKSALRKKGSLPITDAKATMRADVKRRAARGKPNVSGLLRFRRPLTDNGQFRPGRIEFPVDYALGSISSRTRIHSEDLLFWLHEEQIVAALDAELEAKFKPDFAMTAAEHAAELARLDSEILDLDYRACGFAAIAELQGLTIEYRQKVGSQYFFSDPLAILQVHEVAMTDEIPTT